MPVMSDFLTPTRKKLLNFASFQVTWFSAVLGAAHHLIWLGIALALIFLFLHLLLADNLKQESLIILLTSLAGGVPDLCLYHLKMINFIGMNPWQPFLPPWMCALWLMFTSTFNSSLAWLQKRYLLAAACGALAGPLSYFAGIQLGALWVVNLSLTMLTLAIIWALLLPFLFWLTSRIIKEFSQER